MRKELIHLGNLLKFADKEERFLSFDSSDREDLSILVRRIISTLSKKDEDVPDKVYNLFQKLIQYIQQFNPEDIISSVNPELLQVIDPNETFWEFINYLQHKTYLELNQYEKENLQILHDFILDIYGRLFISQ